MIPVTIANRSPHPFVGWKRVTIDQPLDLRAGTLDGASFVVGRQIGLDLRAVDVHVSLMPFEVREFDLSTASPSAVAVPALPADPLKHFGGPLLVDGKPLGFQSIDVNGAAVEAHLRARIDTMLHLDVWIRWYPDQPGLVTGEAVVCCSNGSVPDMGRGVFHDINMQWGDGLVHVIGAGWGAPLVPSGTRFADGQARAVPFVIAWQRHMTTPMAVAQVTAAVGLTTCAVGVQKLWLDGNPSYPEGFDPVAWSAQTFQRAVARLHTWEPGVCGPNPTSRDTGAQEDQVFVRGEAMLPNGVGAEQVAYLSALKLAARPCHHLEADGRQADPDAHPDCVFWDGRPHYHPGVSPDRLGKVGTLPETNGWFGPDREHWLYNTVAAAARLVDSPALQWELEQQARIFLFGETVRPGWSTSGPDAARSVGWAGLLVVHLWRGLTNRTLAQRVRQRWIERVNQVYIPFLGEKPHDIWDVRSNDPRLGPGSWWMAWQQSIGSYGLDLACRLFDLPAGRALALKAAKACLEYNWIQQGDRYHGVGNVQFPPPPPSFYAGRAWPEPWFETTWDLPAIAVVLLHEPGNQKARAILDQAMGDIGTRSRSWLPPGIVASELAPA